MLGTTADCPVTVGCIVRSFDFPDRSRDTEGENACFVEGEVVEIGRFDFECDRYKIKVKRVVFGGETITDAPNRPDFVYPPLNGTPTWGGGVVNCVEVVTTAQYRVKGVN